MKFYGERPRTLSCYKCHANFPCGRPPKYDWPFAGWFSGRSSGRSRQIFRLWERTAIWFASSLLNIYLKILNSQVIQRGKFDFCSNKPSFFNSNKSSILYNKSRHFLKIWWIINVQCIYIYCKRTWGQSRSIITVHGVTHGPWPFRWNFSEIWNHWLAWNQFGTFSILNTCEYFKCPFKQKVNIKNVLSRTILFVLAWFLFYTSFLSDFIRPVFDHLRSFWTFNDLLRWDECYFWIY